MVVMEMGKRGILLILVLALLMVPAMQVSAQELPEVPEQNTIREPEEPEAFEEPEEPEEPKEPEEPEEPEESEEPEEPEESEEPAEPGAPEEPEGPEESEEPAEPEESEEPEEPEESEDQEQPGEREELEEPMEREPAAMWSLPCRKPIADVLKLQPGEETLCMEGIVVFAQGTQAVLQDETGGIRLSFAKPADLAPGDVLTVVGHRSGGFAVEEFEKTGTQALPAQEGMLSAEMNAVRLWVKGALLGHDTLSQNGFTCQLEANLPEGVEIGDRVDAWGVLLDSIFYADTITRSENQEPEEPETDFSGDWNFYFGQLHAHTNFSDGTGTVQEAFAWAKAAENLDFFAVTDHSNSFDNAEQGTVNGDGAAISRKWAEGKAAASAATDETFVGIFGYEMTWRETAAIGHINTFGTSGWQTRDQAGMNTLKGYLDALAAAPDSVSQFNHPGADYGDFLRFSQYSPVQDARVHLLEVGEAEFYGAFSTALDAGWHLAPSNNRNDPHGSWDLESGSRTVVLARELTEEAIYDAIRNYRVYATEDADLAIEYRLNGRIMGSILPEMDTLTATVRLQDGSGDLIDRVEVVMDAGAVAASVTVQEAAGEYALEVPAGGSYYYLQLYRSNALVAVTAPVWVDTFGDLGIADFTAEQTRPQQGVPTGLTLELFNQEQFPFVVESVDFALGEGLIETVTAPGTVTPLGGLEIPLTYACETPGAVTITATVQGTIAGQRRSFQRNLTLRVQPSESELLPVKQVRLGMLGSAYRIRGYVTAGTAKPCNTFPNSIFVQDDSGGIAIADFTREGIALGTPVEIEGILRSVRGNLVLAMTDYEILEEDSYRYVPRTMRNGVAMDYEAHGGELLQLEGHVVSLTKTADKLGVSRFTIRDIVGGLATVVIDDGIGSGAYGTNELASEVLAGRAVRAMGLLHIDEYGQTVLRVRNCDEVAYVPPVRDPSNPRTGDGLLFRMLSLTHSAAIPDIGKIAENFSPSFFHGKC